MTAGGCRVSPTRKWAEGEVLCVGVPKEVR